ncbi:predicted protein [Lichtheimia corymbifera JMRC:FSU:9682]|uniref:Uncharacterized protein n=1 Tax=Lichtheimia corymbifera JMRC:FSU:9682 TaxID=1263082 RepID=A0A068SFM4_9FUNG|nr:predicted protein [Lichtheimia corymbifera JMRC:FSU:9682]
MECPYHVTTVLVIGSGIPKHSNCTIPHLKSNQEMALSLQYLSISLTLIQVTLIISSKRDIKHRHQTSNIKVSIIVGLGDMQDPCINKGVIEQTCRETNVRWHQDQSGGYASLCRSGSQGTVRPPIKSRLAVGCRAESVQHHEPSLKEGLAFNIIIKNKRA